MKKRKFIKLHFQLRVNMARKTLIDWNKYNRDKLVLSKLYLQERPWDIDMIDTRDVLREAVQINQKRLELSHKKLHKFVMKNPYSFY